MEPTAKDGDGERVPVPESRYWAHLKKLDVWPLIDAVQLATGWNASSVYSGMRWREEGLMRTLYPKGREAEWAEFRPVTEFSPRVRTLFDIARAAVQGGKLKNHNAHPDAPAEAWLVSPLEFAAMLQEKNIPLVPGLVDLLPSESTKCGSSAKSNQDKPDKHAPLHAWFDRELPKHLAANEGKVNSQSLAKQAIAAGNTQLAESTVRGMFGKWAGKARRTKPGRPPDK